MDQLEYQKKVIREEYLQLEQKEDKVLEKVEKRLPVKKSFTKFIQK